MNCVMGSQFIAVNSPLTVNCRLPTVDCRQLTADYLESFFRLDVILFFVTLVQLFLLVIQVDLTA